MQLRAPQGFSSNVIDFLQFIANLVFAMTYFALFRLKLTYFQKLTQFLSLITFHNYQFIKIQV